MPGLDVFVAPEGRALPDRLDAAWKEAPERMDLPAAEGVGSVPESREVAARRADEILEVDEANAAPSMEVQAREIGEYFRETPELQYESWVRMSPDERLEALQGLEAEAAAIAHREEMRLRMVDLGEGNCGMVLEDGLGINAGLMEDGGRDSYRIALETVLHEGRHSYQFENIDLAEAGQAVLEQNTEWVNAWRVNLEDLGYSRAEHNIDGLGFERYYTQPIEVDARAFSAQALREMGLR